MTPYQQSARGGDFFIVSSVSDRTVTTSIAYDFGYESPSAFTAVFQCTFDIAKSLPGLMARARG